MLKIAGILVATLLLGCPGWAQRKDTLGWDLSYASVLEQNRVARSELIWQWLNLDRSPAENWITTWQGKPIISSVLIEFPAMHAAERTTMWFVRTADEAHYWEQVANSRPERNEESVPPRDYDEFFRQASAWHQLRPKAPHETPKDTWPGYMGFIGFYDQTGSRQMLLTMEDFVICIDVRKGCEPGAERLKIGRLMAALEFVFPTNKYPHKSEAEIARMTPDQRIEEEVNETEHRSMSDNHNEVIRKYRIQDGLKGWSRLVELIDGYQPKRLRDTRFYAAMMIAAHIDDRVVRLRASPEGLRVIEAVERLSARRRAEGKDDEILTMELRSMKGVSDADRAIRDTLWVKYRIRVTDHDLARFSDYLVKNVPEYPSWSEREVITDRSRKNKWGNPLQVFIMKKSDPYHRQYRSFKRKTT